MNAPLKPVHSPFGGSVAARVLRCPGSVKLVETVPAHLRKSSVYADRGTALHAAMALLLDDDAPSLDSLINKTINDYTITDDDIEIALRPVLTYVEALLNAPGAAFYVERHVVFPGIANTFGTCDLLVRIGNTIHVIDFKFGAIPVLALYRDDSDDIINAQPLFYAAGGRHTLPEFFAGVDRVILSILQPQSIELDEMVSSVEVTHAELDEFVAVYRGACEEALSEAPRLERGAWCRFCPAKPICPLYTGPLLDLAQFAVPASPPLGSAPPDKAAYLAVLAAGLNLVNAVKEIGKALHDQAKQALESGDSVPGFALTAGRAVREWREDEGTAIAALKRLGLRHDDIIVEAMRSPKQVELRAKARGVKVPKELISSKPSGVSLVKAENVRAPILGRGELAREFSEALQAFQQGGKSNDRS